MHRPGKLAGFHSEQNIACICQRILHARDPKHTDQVKVKSQQKAFANSDYQTFAIHMHTIKTIRFGCFICQPRQIILILWINLL